MSQKLELRGVHVYQKVPNQPGAFRLARVNPYLRLSREAGTLYIQGGQVFAEEGGAIPAEQLPAWFKEEVQKASKAALREVGWPVAKG